MFVTCFTKKIPKVFCAELQIVESWNLFQRTKNYKWYKYHAGYVGEGNDNLVAFPSL